VRRVPTFAPLFLAASSREGKKKPFGDIPNLCRGSRPPASSCLCGALKGASYSHVPLFALRIIASITFMLATASSIGVETPVLLSIA